ncbi:lipase-like PAD4 [Cryptomeria japonica]|uniref:lipase-like PAD4 n=1 Tax=Cryptomeria japonica TaxID=3369 RepID=UPI0027DA3E40|nr:lipase-like PAD4 [Cryptomeria japonica]
MNFESMDEDSQPTGQQFAAGQEQAIFLSSCEILNRAWEETRSIPNDNDNTYFRWSEYEGVPFIAFPSFHIGDFTASDSSYEQCDIKNENKFFSDRLKDDNDQPALVHKGALYKFLDIMKRSDLETQMKQFSEQIKEQKVEQPIIFVGHSIGGAMATLSTICFLDKRLKNIYPLCITFGSPLVGNAALRESIGSQDWLGRFCHVVSKHDFVPRMLLAPFESIAPHLNSIFSQGEIIMGNDSDPIQACGELLDNVKWLGKSSPYKPFGIYMICSTQGAACIEDSQAALEMLILTLQSTEENGIADALISEHTSYGDKLKNVFESGYSTRTSNIFSESFIGTGMALQLESSVEMGIALQLEAMGFQTLTKSAFDALKKAANLKNQYDMDIKDLNSELSENQSRLAELEWYIKTVSKGNSCSSYDVFRDLGEKKDFRINRHRMNLEDFWDKIIDMVKNHQLPSDFRYQNKWINAGTAYRRLVEPLDIADFYHLHSDRGSYLSIKNRPLRHRVLEKWLDDKNQTRIERGRGRKKTRTKFASLTEDSRFWARVEEADKDLTNLQPEKEQTVIAHLKKSLKDFEAYVSKMIEEKSISMEVFFEESVFMIWWKKYREFQQQHSEEWKSSSPLLKSMEKEKLGVQKTGF